MIFISDKDKADAEACKREERRRSGDRKCRSTRNREENKRLDRIFANDVAQLERTICSLDLYDRSLAAEWINKLKHSNNSTEERIARNEITVHLLKCKNTCVFKSEPYNRPPPAQSVATLSRATYFSPTIPCAGAGSYRQNDQQYINNLFNECPDQGSFLSQVPVPRDGSFFILHLRPNL